MIILFISKIDIFFRKCASKQVNNSMSSVCDSCEGEPAKEFCITCDQYYCSGCFEYISTECSKCNKKFCCVSPNVCSDCGCSECYDCYDDEGETCTFCKYTKCKTCQDENSAVEMRTCGVCNQTECMTWDRFEAPRCSVALEMSSGSDICGNCGLKLLVK